MSDTGPRIRRAVAAAPVVAALLALAALGLAPAAASAQTAAQGEAVRRKAVKLYAYTFEHQRAGEALALVEPLLSARGSVELQRAQNTLVIRDEVEALYRIVPVLRRFDHPPRQVELEVQIVQADRAFYSPVLHGEELDEPLLSRLRKILPFRSYRVISRTDLRPREGEEVVYELGAGFRVGFRLATLVDDRELKLVGFRVYRTSADSRPLLHSTLSLRTDQPTALGLASTEESESALMVVFTPDLRSTRGER